MDQFEPIADKESGVTERIRSLLQELLEGKARAEDYTAQFWKEIEQDRVRAITEFKMLGKVESLTLVDRYVEGDNSSYRFLAVFNDLMPMELQMRNELHGDKRVALVELESVQWK